MSSIFFRVTTDNPDNEPCVEVLIYNGGRDDDSAPSRHLMTIEGAIVRMHDLQAAIEEAELKRAGGQPVRCTTCGSLAHTTNDCPEEVLVYAVKVNGEDYMLVAHDLEGLSSMVAEGASYGQCQNCGSFDYKGETVGCIIRHTPGTTTYSAECRGCGKRYPISLKPSKEVCF